MPEKDARNGIWWMICWMILLRTPRQRRHGDPHDARTAEPGRNKKHGTTDHHSDDREEKKLVDRQLAHPVRSVWCLSYPNSQLTHASSIHPHTQTHTRDHASSSNWDSLCPLRCRAQPCLRLCPCSLCLASFPHLHGACFLDLVLVRTRWTRLPNGRGRLRAESAMTMAMREFYPAIGPSRLVNGPVPLHKAPPTYAVPSMEPKRTHAPRSRSVLQPVSTEPWISQLFTSHSAGLGLCATQQSCSLPSCKRRPRLRLYRPRALQTGRHAITALCFCLLCC